METDYSFKHVLTVLLVGIFVLLALGGIIGGCVYDRDRDRNRDERKRVAVEQCIQDENRSAVDCRVAVYGRVGTSAS